MYPEVAADALAWITADQMREVDRVMTEDLHIELIQMMENAGRSLARLVRERFAPSSVAVYAGAGGNGGGGLVAARHLANAGVAVTVVLAPHRADIRGVPADQLDIAVRMGVSVVDDPVDVDLAVDALVGYSLVGDLRGRVADLVAGTRRASIVVALDGPSGVDTTTGRVGTPSVEADATLALAMPKAGLRGTTAAGELYLADISVPRSVFVGLGVPAKRTPDWSAGSILRVVGD
jgi:NAD(P)H-hydrate epimerase